MNTNLKPHFYTVKHGFTGVYLFFLFLLQNIGCGYSLELPRRGGSNMYQQSIFWAKISKFLLKIFNFYNLGKTCISHGHVFVMILLFPQSFISVSILLVAYLVQLVYL